MKVYYFEVDVRNVTFLYYDIILNALKLNNYNIESISSLTKKNISHIDKKDYILVTTLSYYIKLWLLGYRNIIFWFQGITPEEDHLRTGSYLRYKIYSYIEAHVLKHCKYKICVSEYMVRHYINKYKLKCNSNDFFIMPCFNSDFCESSFFVPSKYDNNTFCYAGGMHVWQGFESMVILYKKIEERISNSLFKVYSKDTNEALRILKKYEIKRFSLDFVSPDVLEKELSKCKFGFLIREDNVINNVATPTKFATYISNGVIPIYTDCIKAYSEFKNESSFLCCDTYDNLEKRIIELCSEDMLSEEIYQDFKRLFYNHFNKSKYISSLCEFLKL